MASRDNIPVQRGTGKAGRRAPGPVAATLAAVMVLAAMLTASGCTSVSQMQARYEAGDESQLQKIVNIAARLDYPYATRKAAAEALGEIGDPRAVPVLVSILGEFDQRTTLKQEALLALGRIGDPGAVTAIGRLLDRSLGDTNDELRMAAMPILGRLGGEESAQLLVNALAYYDIVMLQKEGRVPRGVFTGDEQSMRALQDSLRRRPPAQGSGADLGGLAGGFGTGGLFGPSVELPQQARVDRTPEERRLAHETLVRVGEAAVPVIETHLGTKQTTLTLHNELRDILNEIRNEAPGSPSGEATEPTADPG